ncbi:hypothetical protein L6R29_24545 [Myxococcota bacterium]|nr:hypothetical protein [Myxococcota bacterium]
MTLQLHTLGPSAKGLFRPQQNDVPPHERLPMLSEEKIKEATRTQRLPARSVHTPESQTFAGSMRSQYNKPLTDGPPQKRTNDTA